MAKAKAKRFQYVISGNVFEVLGAKAMGICKQGLYEGANAVADAVRAAVPKDSGDLASSLYVAKFRESYQEVNTVIGFSGYDSKGVPNPMKAAVLESGSSRGAKATHFFSKAVRSAQAGAEAAMAQEIETRINEITEGNGG